MGFNPGMLDMMIRWARDYGIDRGARMLDIGTSELFCAADPESLNRFLVHFGAKPYAGAGIVPDGKQGLCRRPV